LEADVAEKEPPNWPLKADVVLVLSAWSTIETHCGSDTLDSVFVSKMPSRSSFKNILDILIYINLEIKIMLKNY
jgi:hypothetical protein